MGVADFVTTMLDRWSYPVSLPKEVACALGITLPDRLSFDQFIDMLISPDCRPTKLCRFMPREKAENVFRYACKKECFVHESVISYCFRNGWLEFVLKFDCQGRLRRVYIQHELLHHDEGVELLLQCCN